MTSWNMWDFCFTMVWVIAFLWKNACKQSIIYTAFINFLMYIQPCHFERIALYQMACIKHIELILYQWIKPNILLDTLVQELILYTLYFSSLIYYSGGPQNLLLVWPWNLIIYHPAKCPFELHILKQMHIIWSPEGSTNDS